MPNSRSLRKADFPHDRAPRMPRVIAIHETAGPEQSGYGSRPLDPTAELENALLRDLADPRRHVDPPGAGLRENHLRQAPGRSRRYDPRWDAPGDSLAQHRDADPSSRHRRSPPDRSRGRRGLPWSSVLVVLLVLFSISTATAVVVRVTHHDAADSQSASSVDPDRTGVGDSPQATDPAGEDAQSASPSKNETVIERAPPEEALGPQTNEEPGPQTAQVLPPPPAMPEEPKETVRVIDMSAPAEPKTLSATATTRLPHVPAITAEPQADRNDAGAATGGQTVGRIVRAVTMRAGPSNGAKAITVIPANAEVQVEPCKYWCKVEFDGRSGWVFRKFLSL